MLLGMAGRHAVMLHRAKLDAQRGVPQEAALEKASRRAFIFTRKDVLAHQFGLWTSDALKRAIEILGQALQDCRRDARLSDVIATRAFWSSRRSGSQKRPLGLEPVAKASSCSREP